MATGVIGASAFYIFLSGYQKVEQITDGDTVVIKGEPMRLLGVDTPEMGSAGSKEARDYLTGLVKDKKVWVEQDRYLTDRYGRRLVWLWVDCEGIPQFKDAFYMVKTDGSHSDPLLTNPNGCVNGKLVNEEILKSGIGKFYVLQQKGELKYEQRLKELSL